MKIIGDENIIITNITWYCDFIFWDEEKLDKVLPKFLPYIANVSNLFCGLFSKWVLLTLCSDLSVNHDVYCGEIGVSEAKREFGNCTLLLLPGNSAVIFI